jgi:hypothetical protein
VVGTLIKWAGSCRQKKRIKDKDALSHAACRCCNTNIRVRFKSFGSLGNDSQIHAFGVGSCFLQPIATMRPWSWFYKIHWLQMALAVEWMDWTSGRCAASIASTATICFLDITRRSSNQVNGLRLQVSLLY